MFRIRKYFVLFGIFCLQTIYSQNSVETQLAWADKLFASNQYFDAITEYKRVLFFDNRNELKAKIFFVAYTKDDCNSSTRPVTFAFNGGPSSSSVWLHFGALGPKRAGLTSKGELPHPPYKIINLFVSILLILKVVVSRQYVLLHQ